MKYFHFTLIQRSNVFIGQKVEKPAPNPFALSDPERREGSRDGRKFLGGMHIVGGHNYRRWRFSLVRLAGS